MVRKDRAVLTFALIMVAASALWLLAGSLINAARTDVQAAQADTDTALVRPQAPGLQSFRTVFADVAASVTPTVVSVILTKIDTVSFYRNPFYHFFDDDSDAPGPFGRFFGAPKGKSKKDDSDVEKKEFRRQGLGSGVIVNKDGYVLTNYHVIAGANEIQVKLADGRQFEAVIVGSDSLTDVAVIKLKTRAENLPVAILGDDASLRPGDWVMAIGNPFNLTSTVTLGIVSAIGRQVEDSKMYQNYIQTDAAINPGNSGGALVNIDGKVIGINTMIYSETGGFMGIGFAIPISLAHRIMNDLIRHGRVTRGWIGISVQELNDPARELLGLGDRKGILVSDVYKGQPAERAGIRRGDIILAIDGAKTATGNDLRFAVAGLPPEKEVPVAVMRNGKETTLSVTPSMRDENEIASLGQSHPRVTPPGGVVPSREQLSMKLADLTPEVKRNFGIDEQETGIMVVEVSQSVGDERAGLATGDVIEQIKTGGHDFQPVLSVTDFANKTILVGRGRPIMLLVRRFDTTFYVTFKQK